LNRARPIIISAIPTPFDETEKPALGRLSELLIQLREKTIDAVFIAGTTGEFTALDDEERLDAFRVALGVFGPDRVFAHVGAASAYQAERLARRARDIGALHLAAVTPFFQPAPPDQIVEYYRRIVEAGEGARVYAYLFRQRTTTFAPPTILERLAEVGVAGVKISGETDSSVDGYLQNAPEHFAVYSGNDVSLRWLVGRGGKGVVSGVSSAYPEPFVRLRDALIANDADAIATAERIVQRAVAAVRGGSVSHLKAAISARGIPFGGVRTATESVPASDERELFELALRV